MNTLLRFAAVGTATTCLDILLFNLGLMFGLPPVQSHAASTAFILPISFIGQRRAFRSSSKPLLQACRFLQVVVVGAFVVQVIVLFVMLAALGSSPAGANASKLVAMAIGIAWNFVMFCFYVFPATQSPIGNQTSREDAGSAGNRPCNERPADGVDLECRARGSDAMTPACAGIIDEPTAARAGGRGERAGDGRNLFARLK